MGLKNTYQLWYIKDLIEATLTKLPFWDNLSEQERTLTKCGATHCTYEKGVYIFDYSDSCMGMVYVPKGSIRVFITSEEGRDEFYEPFQTYGH